MAIDTLGANALASNSVTTAKIVADAVTSAKIPAGAVVASDVADGSVTTAKLADNAVTSAKSLNLGRRNMIINGAMQVAQRGTSFTGHGAGVNYGIDRFFDYHSSDGAFTLSQETSVVPVGFSNALKIQTTTADSSIAAGQRLIVGQRLEGLNVAHLNWGTSNAKTVTLSFYVRSSVTGTHGGAIGNGSDNRNYPFTYTISSADTWERKTITIAGDTTGTWATTTARSLQVTWGLGVGSTYSGSAGAWAAGDKNSATGATTSVLGTLNATWYLTGVQLEIGSAATDFEHRSFGEELSLCQRYYYRHVQGHATDRKMCGIADIYAGTQINLFVYFPQYMRVPPTSDSSHGTGYYSTFGGGNPDFNNAWNIFIPTNAMASFYTAPAANQNSYIGRAVRVYIPAGETSAHISLKAEL